MKLKSHRVGLHQPAGQPCPPDGVLTFSNPLLRRASPVVEGHHPLWRTRQVRDEEPDTRAEPARVPLDLNDDPAGAAPGLSLVAEAGRSAGPRGADGPPGA